jgi:hypothetical protein
MVCYGTTKLDINKCSHVDLIIQHNGRMAELELPMAVRFDLGMSNWLLWAEEFFQPPEHSFYILAGTLNANEIARLRTRLKRRGLLPAL